MRVKLHLIQSNRQGREEEVHEGTIERIPQVGEKLFLRREFKNNKPDKGLWITSKINSITMSGSDYYIHTSNSVYYLERMNVGETEWLLE